MADRKRTDAVDWADLQFLVALARHGGLSSAARALGVTHATVSRRIGALEQSLGQPLFVRQNGRYVPTSTGARVAAMAASMEEAALGIVRAVAGLQPEVAGPVRVTSTDLVASALVAPVISDLRQTHPALEVELVVSRENLSLARRDADIALRLGEPTQGDLFRRKLGDLAYFRYASRRYTEQYEPARYGYIGYCHTSPGLPEVLAFESLYDGAPVVLRTNNISTRHAAVRSGVGVALLPKLIAGEDGDLVQLDEAPVVVRELWLIVHRDMRDVPRVRVCVERIATGIEGQRRRMV